MKPLTATQHGLLDYGVGVLLLAGPWIFNFNEVSAVVTYTMVAMGSIVLLLSLFTNYPLGIIKAVPFPTHGAIETVGAIGLLASPWVMDFAELDIARNLAIIVSVAYLGVIALTNYHSAQITMFNYDSRYDRAMHRPSH
jgi:hypothetical protein